MKRPALRTLQGKDNLVGCEVGTAEGENAFDILNELAMRRLYLVDPYCFQETNKPPGVFPSKDEAEQAMAVARRRLYPFLNKVVWIRKSSEDLVPTDIQGILDFVYIDGNHSYEAVNRDILVFFPMIRKGGLLSGHDYGAKGTGVKQAIDEFCQKHGYKVSSATDDLGGRDDWWFTV